MSIAAFELLPADAIYEGLFDMQVPAEALNDRYEALGLEHWLLMNNLGTFGCILLFSPFLYVGYYVIACCKGFKICRRATKRLEPKLFWGFLLRMIIEGYVITLICCLINIRRLDFEVDTKWVFSNSIITVVIMPILIFFPIFSICYMLSNFNDLNEVFCKERFGELYAAYSLKNKTMLLYWGLEYSRKLLLATIVVFVQDDLGL